MQSMYRENILDHAKNPRYPGVLDPCDIVQDGINPLCGDHLRLTLRLDENGHIREIAWDGEGCAISQASASMLGEQVVGKPLNDVVEITPDDVVEMLGVPLTPNRMKCALLALTTLNTAIENWKDEA